MQKRYIDIHARLPVSVASTLLQADSCIELPLWLIQMFKVIFLDICYIFLADHFFVCNIDSSIHLGSFEILACNFEFGFATSLI
jgi:hypothetical protein